MSKKTILLINFLLLVLYSFSQRHFIPDTAFRETLKSQSIPFYGVNLDSIDEKDLQNIKELKVEAIGLNKHHLNIKNIKGIEAFKDITLLDVHSSNQLEFIKDPLPQNISILYVGKVTVFDVKNHNKLIDLTFENSPDSIISMPNSIKTIYFLNGANYINKFPFATEYIYIYNGIYKLPFPPLPDSLIGIGWHDGAYSKIEFSVLDKWPPKIKGIALKQLPAIKLPPFPKSLTTLYLYQCESTELPDLPEGLISLFINEGKWNCIPVLPNTLKYLNFDSCLNIKCIPNRINAVSSPSLNFYSLCSENSGCAYTYNLNGKVYLDYNSNCTFDLSEDLLKDCKINLLDSNYNIIKTTFSDQNGKFFFSVIPGKYIVKPDIEIIPFDLKCNVQSIRINNSNVEDSSLNIGLNCKGGTDIGISTIISNSEFRPNANIDINLIAGDFLKHFGASNCDSSIGDIKLQVNGGVIFKGSKGQLKPIWDSLNGNIFLWNKVDFKQADFNQSFILNFEVDSNSKAGEYICFKAKIYTNSSDIDTTNDSFEHCFIIRNSHDPNFKEVSPPDTFTFDQDWLTYTIHFQNIGSIEAINIKIIDSLSNYVYPESVKFIKSSHDSKLYIDSNGYMIIKFDKIYLIDSATDEKNSKGFFQFKVKRKSNINLGNSISNRAYIYFDYNPFIKTNTASTSFGKNKIDNFNLISKSNYVKNPSSNIQVYPNPVLNILNLKNLPNNSIIEIYDLTGKLLIKYIEHSNTTNLNVSFLKKGLYILKIEDFIIKFMKD